MERQIETTFYTVTFIDFIDDELTKREIIVADAGDSTIGDIIPKVEDWLNNDQRTVRIIGIVEMEQSGFSIIPIEPAESARRVQADLVDYR